VKTQFLFFIVLVTSIAIPVTAFAQNPVNCHFGDDSTSQDEIFRKDLAVKAFTQKYPNATRYVAIEEQDPLQGELSFTIETKQAKEILLIKFNQNESGCYRPYSYHYSYNDGKIDVTIRNSLSDFTEIVNLIKTDNKKIEDLFTKNCNPIQLDYVLSGGAKPYFCKYDINNSIEMSLQKHVGGIIEVHIPNKIMDALFYDCVLNDDFFVLNNGEEIYYDLVIENDTRIFKMDLPPGYSKNEIIRTGWMADTDFCGSIWSEDSRYISPLMQTKIGVKSWMVQCNEGLSLLIKPGESTKPVCVTDSTYEELSSRGWSLVGIWNDANANKELELRRIETGPANDPNESFQEKYDAVVEGSIIGCMGHKETYPIRYQCDIQVDSYIKYYGEKTGQLTVIAYRDRLDEDNQKAIFGLEYHEDENYYEIIETGFTRK